MAPTPRLALPIVAGTLACLRLAVPGRGGFGTLLAHPARVAVAIVVFELAGVALLGRGNLGPGEREDRADRRVPAAAAPIGPPAAHLPAHTDREGFRPLDRNATRCLGVTLIAAGGALRLRPVSVLGRQLSGLAAVQPGHALVTTGPHGVVRPPGHPRSVVDSPGRALAPRPGLGVLLATLLVPPLRANTGITETAARGSVAPTTPIAAARGAYFPGSIEAGCRRGPGTGRP